jgi:mRNA interferase MazF
MADTTGKNRKTINQGDIYWLPLKEQDGSEPDYIHPHVVVQDDLFNHSRIHTVIVCALTTNIKRARLPGNVLLEAGEANLPKPSVVVVSQISSVDKAQLGEYIGSLTRRRIDQILAGIRFLQRSTERESQIRRTNDER